MVQRIDLREHLPGFTPIFHRISWENPWFPMKMFPEINPSNRKKNCFYGDVDGKHHLKYISIA